MRHLRLLPAAFAALLLVLPGAVACADDLGPAGTGGVTSGARSNRARFTFDCDLNGMTGVMTMDVEVVGDAGIVYGPGANPDITGVIGTGGVTYYTAGEVRSATAYYVFTGENQLADFTNMGNHERFRVQWLGASDGLVMRVNPFGRGPTQHRCALTGARYL